LRVSELVSLTWARSSGATAGDAALKHCHAFQL
jgi:hypothetical protein